MINISCRLNCDSKNQLARAFAIALCGFSQNKFCVCVCVCVVVYCRHFHLFSVLAFLFLPSIKLLLCWKYLCEFLRNCFYFSGISCEWQIKSFPYSMCVCVCVSVLRKYFSFLKRIKFLLPPIRLFIEHFFCSSVLYSSLDSARFHIIIRRSS